MAVGAAQDRVRRNRFDDRRAHRSAARFDSRAEVYLQLDRRALAPPVWVGLMDTAVLFDEENDFQLVISPWKPEGYPRPESDERRTCHKALAEPVVYDHGLDLSE
jgi:hypothetical protein